MHRRQITLLLAAAFILPPVRALAWNDTGHMLVAEIAFRHLESGPKARANRLVKLLADPASSTFVTASCYMDDIKKQTREFNDWHFVDQPFSADGTTPQVTYNPQNVIWAIGQCIRTVTDPKSANKDKAQRLAFLIHLVGDVHQPLHCATRVTSSRPEGDRGGNLFEITGLDVTNLHALWDEGAGLFKHLERPLNPQDQLALKQLADRIEADNPPRSFRELPDRDIQHWADESKAFARAVAYDKLVENSTPPSSYLHHARSAAARRVVLAGYRLADLLNVVLR